MTQVVLPKTNQTGSNEWADVEDNDRAIKEVVNGKLDNDNLSGSAGITAANLAGEIPKSKLATDAKPAVTWYTPSIVATEQTRTNTSYGKLSTADEIKGVVLPENGLIMLGYKATWKRSAGAQSAAVFLGANQLKVANMNGDVSSQEALGGESTNFTFLTSGPIGLLSGGETTYAGDATTGQVLGGITGGSTGALFWQTGTSAGRYPEHANYGGLCPIFASAGTYDISVQFKCSGGGTATVKDRKLWVWVLGV